MEIKVKIKNVYGRELIYPVNEAGLLFARLVNKTTLSSEDLALIEKLGFKVVVVPPTLKGE